MKLAIIGSRDIDPIMAEIAITNYIGLYKDDVEIISGGAIGVDTITQNVCSLNKIPIEIIYPINFNNKINFLYRNIEIITKADKILAIWNGTSRGTKFVIDYAKARNKDIKVLNFGE